MTVIPPRYEARQNRLWWGVWDTFAQEWAWHFDRLARFDNLSRTIAIAQSNALNRIYERAL